MKMKIRIEQAVRKHVSEGKISCATAHAVAKSLQVTPLEVGTVIDEMDIRLTECRLGLFGRRPRATKAKPDTRPTPELEVAIREALQDKRLSCDAAWTIAKKLNLPATSVSNACEALGVKIARCRLGIF